MFNIVKLESTAGLLPPAALSEISTNKIYFLPPRMPPYKPMKPHTRRKPIRTCPRLIIPRRSRLSPINLRRLRTP